MTFYRYAFLLLISFSLSSCQSVSDNTLGALKSLLTGELTDSNIAAGLKEALGKGTEKAVSNLSKNGGYSKNALYKITVPEDLQKFGNTLRKIGLGSQVDHFEAKMNEAAEEACLKARPIFMDAISDMTLEDVRKILMGSKTAATDYFHGKTSQKLKAQYFPIVKTKMEEIGLVGDYNKLIDRYNSIPFTPKVNFKLEDYVTDKALVGLFSKVAEAEKDIRENPIERTSALLKRVFAEQDAK